MNYMLCYYACVCKAVVLRRRLAAVAPNYDECRLLVINVLQRQLQLNSNKLTISTIATNSFSRAPRFVNMAAPHPGVFVLILTLTGEFPSSDAEWNKYKSVIDAMERIKGTL